MTDLRPALWAVAIYIGIVFVATYLTYAVAEAPLDTWGALMRNLPLQILLLVLCGAYVSRYSGWSAVGFQTVQWSAIVWLVPSIVLIGTMAVVTLPRLAKDGTLPMGPVQIGLLLLVPALIGLTEEIMFRGILLRAALKRMPVARAMLLSAGLFGLMHGVNSVTGQTFSATFQQAVFAFLVGLFLAPVALRAGSLWVVIIWHAVWDFLVYATQLTGIIHHYALIGILIQTLTCMWLWARLVDARA